MSQVRTSPLSYPHEGPPQSEACPGSRVVEMRGEYDRAKVPALCIMLSAAIAVDDSDLVIDASEVTFVDAATIRVLVRARIFLDGYSRSLLVRSPSRVVLRIFDICELNQFIESMEGQPVVRGRFTTEILDRERQNS